MLIMSINMNMNISIRIKINIHITINIRADIMIRCIRESTRKMLVKYT